MTLMTYTEVAPPPELAEWVASYWSFSVDAGDDVIEHRIPLTGGTMISVSPGAPPMLTGPRIDPLVTQVRGGDEYRGIHFIPGRERDVLGVGGRELRDWIGPAFLRIDPELCEALSFTDHPFERWSVALQRRRVPAPEDAGIDRAVALIAMSRGAASVATVARLAGVSDRNLRRGFAVRLGLSPKELSRIMRLRAAAADAALGDATWATVVADRGFADQPHLNREFRSMLGLTPTEFEQHARRIAHDLADWPKSSRRAADDAVA